MIKVKNLKKQFGNNVVLKDISVAIEKGEVISVIGAFWIRKKYIFKMYKWT